MFKVQDLMIEVLATGTDGGGAAMPAPTEPTPPSPISPIAAVAAYSPKFLAIDKAVKFADKVDLRILDDVALDVGRQVVRARVAALCAEDQATCQNNPQISPIAAFGDGVLRTADFRVLREQVLRAAKWIDERGDLLEKRACDRTKELVPRLHRAADYLQSK